MRTLNQAGIDLIKSFEGILDGDPATVNLDPYMDPIGIWTIGWGHAITFGERFLRGAKDRTLAKKLYPNGITIAEAEQLLAHDVVEHTRDMDTLVKVPLTDNQFAAIASLAFNIGVGGFARSSLLKYLNRGDYKTAATRFAPWNTAGGKILAGLTRRRKAEAALFVKP